MSTKEMRILLRLAIFIAAASMIACANRQPFAPLDTTPDAEVSDTDSIDDNSAILEEEPLPVAADELFDDFLFTFASITRLQNERICFPLPMEKNGKAYTIDRSEWKKEYFFMRQGYYTLIFNSARQKALTSSTDVSEAVLERIYLNTNYVEQFFFVRTEGEWMLEKMRGQSIDQNPNASFLKFYKHFVSDSLFQRESLEREIAFEGPDPDNDFEQLNGTVTPDFWEAFAPEFPARVLYNIVYGPAYRPTDERLLIIRGIANGQEIEVTFRRHGDSWKVSALTT